MRHLYRELARVMTTLCHSISGAIVTLQEAAGYIILPRVPSILNWTIAPPASIWIGNGRVSLVDSGVLNFNQTASPTSL